MNSCSPFALNSIINGSANILYPSGAFISVILYFPNGICVIACPWLFVSTSVWYSSESFNFTSILFIVNLSSPVDVLAFL